jgi:hypothetical protein
LSQFLQMVLLQNSSFFTVDIFYRIKQEKMEMSLIDDFIFGGSLIWQYPLCCDGNIIIHQVPC